MSRANDGLARAASLIADLDSPFYAEERQRDVWNEASAVGFQAMIWCMLGLVDAMVWIGGPPLFGWASAVLVLTGLPCFLAIVHAGRQGVTATESMRLPRPRTVLVVLLVAVGVVGVLLRTDGALSPSTVAGAAVGFLAALAGVAASAWKVRRAEAEPEQPLED